MACVTRGWITAPVTVWSHDSSSRGLCLVQMNQGSLKRQDWVWREYHVGPTSGRCLGANIFNLCFDEWRVNDSARPWIRQQCRIAASDAATESCYSYSANWRICYDASSSVDVWIQLRFVSVAFEHEQQSDASSNVEEQIKTAKRIDSSHLQTAMILNIYATYRQWRHEAY